MRKKIVVGSFIFCTVFFISGIYIFILIQRGISSLDRLIMFHQAEIMREHFLIQLQKVQSSLIAIDPRYTKNLDSFGIKVGNMLKSLESCFTCHHSSSTSEKLERLREMTEKYNEGIKRLIIIRANQKKFALEKESTLRQGNELISQVDKLIAITASRLEERTMTTLNKMVTTKKILFLLIITGPIIVTFVSLLFIKNFTEPINELINATKKLKEGKLDHRIPKLKDEFGELAVSFNEMAASLVKHIENLQRTEQLRITGELASGLIHEIKNPVAGIRASIEYLLEDPSLSNTQKEILNRVVYSILHLEKLMKDFLSFARPPIPKQIILNVNDIVNKSISVFFHDKNEHKKVELIKNLQEDIPEIIADPMALQQVLLNIFLNAMDAMPDGGKIYVDTLYDEATNSINIDISDTGKGIDKELIDKIFEPFFTTKRKGTGLGLSICKRLIEQMGGSIVAGNKAEGGAIFRIILPVTKNY